jgi:hypothetical protein
MDRTPELAQLIRAEEEKVKIGKLFAISQNTTVSIVISNSR